MLNSTQILKNVNTENITTFTQKLSSTGFNYFIEHPFIFGGGFILITLALGTIASIFLDRTEGSSQEGIWAITIYIVLFFVILFGLIFLDTTEILVFGNLK